jgi:hypothetical protein
MELIVFIIVGMIEIGPNVCKLDYYTYDDVSSIVIPCAEFKQLSSLLK